MRLTLPDIRHDQSGFKALVRLEAETKDCVFEEIAIDMGGTSWFDADMCAAFGAILYRLGGNLNTVRLTSIRPGVESILLKNGFLSHYGRERIPDRWGTTIPYQRFDSKDDRYFADYIENELIRRSEIPAMSPGLLKKFRESIFEIFSNAVLHSHTKLGIFSCGQFFPKRDRLDFSVADLGIGMRRKHKRQYRAGPFTGGRYCLGDRGPQYNQARPGAGRPGTEAARRVHRFEWRLYSDCVGRGLLAPAKWQDCHRAVKQSLPWHGGKYGNQYSRYEFIQTCFRTERSGHFLEAVTKQRLKVTIMQNEMTISIFETVGSPLCVASGDGQKVYERLAAALHKGRSVTLSFHNVTTLTSAFLNAAIGQLYGVFSEEHIRSLLKVQDMPPDDLALLKRVVETAKQYFKDPQRFDQAVRDELGDNGDDL